MNLQKKACIASALILSFTLQLFGQNREIAFTFDDLPITGRAATLEIASDVNSKLLASLKAHKIPAAGFVNEQKLFVSGEIDARTELLERWITNGHELGNHTFSHIFINNASFEQYKEDLIRGETVTRMLLNKHGKELRFFRHTQLRTGPTDDYRLRLNSLLDERNYTVAPVTIDSNEYLFAVRYSEAKANGDVSRMKLIVDAYLVYMERVTEHFEVLSKRFLNYEVKQILLLHANELNADHLDALIEIFRNRGYRFVSLDHALTDTAYSLPEITSPRGLSWIHRWMLAKGLDMDEEPAEPAWISTQATPMK